MAYQLSYFLFTDKCSIYLMMC